MPDSPPPPPGDDESRVSPRTLKLTVAYDGHRYVGWQRQAAGASIQALLEQAFEGLAGGQVHVHGAGRTDAGVHALGQVASVDLACAHDVATIRRALNAQLPPDVRVLTVDEALPGFHARFHARAKTYRYQIAAGEPASPFLVGRAWMLPAPVDIDAMGRAAALLVGEHDFAAFRSTGSTVSSTVRRLTQSDVSHAAAIVGGHRDPVITYETTGNGFLRHMVRAIVGTLVEVGQGLRAPESVSLLLERGRRDEAGPTAPPEGLFLVRVVY